MKITFTTDGGWTAGIPGLSAPFTVDTGDLDPSGARHLVRMVHEVSRETAAAVDGPASPDAQTVRIDVEDGRSSWSRQYADPADTAAARSLVEHLRELQRGDS